MIIAQRFIAGNRCTENPKSRRDDRNFLRRLFRERGSSYPIGGIFLILLAN